MVEGLPMKHYAMVQSSAPRMGWEQGGSNGTKENKKVDFRNRHKIVLLKRNYINDSQFKFTKQNNIHDCKLNFLIKNCY